MEAIQARADVAISDATTAFCILFKYQNSICQLI
jgi:hypothetical protein